MRNTFAALSKITLVHLALLSVSLIYAATFSIAKEVMPAYVDPFAFILLRVGTAALLFWIIHGLLFKGFKPEKKDLRRFVICGIFGVGANMLLFFKGLSETTPINGAILMTSTPVFVVILSAIMGIEKLTPRRSIGIVLACLGAALLISGFTLKGATQGISFSMQTIAGDVMVMLNAIIYSFYLVYAQPLLVKYHPITVSKYTFFTGLVLVMPFGAPPLKEVAWAEMPLAIYWDIAFVVLAASFLTYLLNAWALRHATPGLVGSYIYLQPVLATMIAILWGKDQLSLEKILFILCIFSGVYLVNRKRT